MILLSLGSNLSSSFGNRFKNLELAISYLQSQKIELITKSSFYETPSYPNNNNPKFINMIINITTKLTPQKLASAIINTEEKLERKRNKKNEPRTCDIDIVDYKGLVIDFNYKNLNFKVPHQKLINRNFVLYPINEILPNWIHPESKEKISDLIAKLPELDRNSILKIKKN